MKQISKYIGQLVELEVSSKKIFKGILIDYGSDIIVIYDNKSYIYLPFRHLQYIKQGQVDDVEILSPSEPCIINGIETISLRKVLNNAKGVFLEIYVTNEKPIYGYITSVMNDYFVFYSPVYRTMFISMNHLKWLIPYPPNQTPYSLNRRNFPVNPANISLARTLEELLKKLEGEIVLFDLGGNPNKIGFLKKSQDNMIELAAGKETFFWNINHLKTLHLANETL